VCAPLTMVDVSIMTATKFHQVALEDDKKIGESLITIFGCEIKLFYDYELTKSIDTEQLPTSLELPDIIYSDYEEEIVAQNKKSTGNKDIFCNHGDNAMCVNCAPVSPWDPKLLRERGIKYLSFGAFKEKNQRIERLTYRNECKHAQNVKCTRCMERTIALKQQNYRMIDHVEIDHSKTVDNFISFWRGTGRNRFGFLLGKIKDYERVPLGKTAVVSAIYDPLQENFPDGFVVHEKECSKIRALLDYIGLDVIGMIYTDLNHKRDYLLSCTEIDAMAKFQNENMFADDDGKVFNSRFVSVVVRNNDAGVELEAYSVSEQGMVLIDENIIKPCTDKQTFVSTHPIIYLEKNEYDLVVEKNTMRVPVEYLIVDIPHGFSEKSMFPCGTYFNPEWGKMKVAKYFTDYSLEKFQNFNVLLYFFQKFNGSDRSLNADMKLLVDAVLGRVRIEKFLQTFTFLKFTDSIESHRKEEWDCKICTYRNLDGTDRCEMCETQRNYG
ncbi:Nuclear pore complex, rNpl4 component (sc Npl4), partial [Trachipleistophora hominis]